MTPKKPTHVFHQKPPDFGRLLGHELVTATRARCVYECCRMLLRVANSAVLEFQLPQRRSHLAVFLTKSLGAQSSVIWIRLCVQLVVKLS